MLLTGKVKATCSFSRFLSFEDPELARTTLMSLCGSYATMMVDAYQKKIVFEGYSEDEFLVFVGKMMKTSVEYLRGTYTSTITKAYK